MSVGETLVVFGGIPLVVILVVTGWAFAADARSAPRYRPGRPFTFTPVWYLAEISPEEPQKSLPAGRSAGRAPAPPLEPGGARGTW